MGSLRRRWPAACCGRNGDSYDYITISTSGSSMRVSTRLAIANGNQFISVHRPTAAPASSLATDFVLMLPFDLRRDRRCHGSIGFGRPLNHEIVAFGRDMPLLVLDASRSTGLHRTFSNSCMFRNGSQTTAPVSFLTMTPIVVMRAPAQGPFRASRRKRLAQTEHRDNRDTAHERSTISSFGLLLWLTASNAASFT